MIKLFGTFIAWFSGSLAGITAALYAFGFVATIGADQLIGIGSEYVSREPGFYVARGGSLIMRTVIVAMWPVLGLIAMAAAFRWLHTRLGVAQRESLTTIRRVAGTAAAPAAAATMLAIMLFGLLYVLQPALSTSGLLFADAIPQDVCMEESGLRKAIYSQTRTELNSWFDAFALGAGVLVGLAVIARLHLLKAGQRLSLAVAGIAGFLALVSVPFVYGILVVEIDPPEIEIEPSPGDDVGPLRLLSRVDSGLLIWLEEKQRIQFISAGRINTFTVGPGEPITTLRCPSQHGATR